MKLPDFTVGVSSSFIPNPTDSLCVLIHSSTSLRLWFSGFAISFVVSLKCSKIQFSETTAVKSQFLIVASEKFKLDNFVSGKRHVSKLVMSNMHPVKSHDLKLQLLKDVNLKLQPINRQEMNVSFS